jgi:hypothetical protein
MRWPIALALFLSAANALAQGSYQHPETRFVFPAVIGAFERQSAEHYPDARLGVKVGYVARGLGRADIYLYDLGIVGIPDGIDSKAVRDAFASAAADVEEMGRRGYYLDLRRISKPGATLEISGRTPRFLLAGYEEPVVSLLIVTGARASFLKVRYTYLASRADGRSELEKLLIDFFAANKSAPGANL